MVRRRVLTLLVTSVAPVPMAAMMGKSGAVWDRITSDPCWHWAFRRFSLSSAWQFMLCWCRTSLWKMTSSWQSGAAWATPYCYVLRCSKPAVSPNQSFRHTKTEGGFHIGLCTRTQGLNKSQNKGHVQSDQAAAYLLYGRSAYWRTAFLFAQKTYRKQCSGYVYDAGYAALLYAGYVRKAWTAPGKDRGQHSQSSCDPSQAASLPDQ